MSTTNKFRIGVALGCLLAAASLAGCSGFQAALAGPNSRTMSMTTLDQSVKPGMTMDEVLARIGQPTYRFRVGLQQQFVWNYRFALPEGDCTVFQVSFANSSALVVETGQGYDRTCDGNSSRD